MAIGDYTEKRLAGPIAVPVAAASSNPPANMLWIIKQIIVVNTDTVVRTVSVGVETGTVSVPAAARVLDIAVQPKDVETLNTYLILDGSVGDKLSYLGAATTLTLTVCGIQKQIA